MTNSTESEKEGSRRFIPEGLALLIVVLLCLPAILVPLETVWQDGALYMAEGLTHARDGIGPASAQFITGTRTRLFPLLLGAAFRLFGASVGSAALVVKAGFVGCIVAAYLIGRTIKGQLAGLLAVLAALGSGYLIRFSNDAKLDAVQAAFMLLSLYLLLRAMRSKTGVLLSVLSGISLGLAFWVKETAVLWLPLPLLTLLTFRRTERFKHGLESRHVLAFSVAAGSAIISWLAFYYVIKNEVWLAGIQVPDGERYAYLIGAGLLLLPVLLWFGRRRLTKATARVLSWPSRSGYLMFLIWSALLTLILIPRGQPIDSWADLPARFANIPLYFLNTVLRLQPLLLVAAISWMIAMFTVLRRSPGFRLLLVSACLYFPVAFMIATPVAGRTWSSRHLMTLFFLSYACIGTVTALLFQKALMSICSKLRLRSIRTVSVVASSGLVLILAAVTLSHSVPIARDYIQSDPLKGLVWFNYRVQDTAEWLDQNVPEGSSILYHSKIFSYSIHFLTGARYDYRLSDSHTLVVMAQGREGWHLGEEAEPTTAFPDPYYVREYSESPAYFYAHSASGLLDEIRRDGVQYLIVTTGKLRSMIRPGARFLRDNPMFEPVFNRSWRGYAIDIYEVDRTEFDDLAEAYPVELVIDSLVLWLARISRGEVPYDEYDLMSAVGKNGILITVDPSEEARTAPLYLQLGDIFADHNDYEAAAFEYRMALAEEPARAPHLQDKAEQILRNQRGEAGAWVLLGEAYEVQDEIELAQHAYSRALQAHAERAETIAAAHRGLGRMHLASGDNEGAIAEFEKALQLSAFDAHTTRKQLRKARRKLDQARGDTSGDIGAYRCELGIDEGRYYRSHAGSAGLELVGLIDQLGAATVDSLVAEEVRPAVFVVDEQPGPVLFAQGSPYTDRDARLRQTRVGRVEPDQG